MILRVAHQTRRKKWDIAATYYLFINSLPAIPALDGVLDDWITAKVLIQACESI